MNSPKVEGPSAVGACQGGFSQRTGQLLVVNDMAYFTDASGEYDVIAAGPSVKDALKQAGNGSYLARIDGRPYERGADQLTGIEARSLAVVQAMDQVVGKICGDPASLVHAGKKLEVVGMTERAKLLLGQAKNIPNVGLNGVIKGSVFEVWSVAIPMRRWPPMQRPAKV